jgi:hypothetical protein
MRPDEVELTVDGKTDVPRMHLMELLHEIAIGGKCPETIFIGVVPKEINVTRGELTLRSGARCQRSSI